MVLAGCTNTAKVLKENLDYRPAVANAFSRAISLGSSEKKIPSSKLAAYPPIPSEENTPRVRSFIRHYAYERRETMKNYLAMVEKHLPMLKAAARENGLPEEISYLVMLESGADPEARSPANALGMWQFMPATARSYGLRVDSWVDERLDPMKSTKAAMMYLKDLYGMFGCWRLALSAYNSGENKLNKVLCQEDAQEYDEICSSRRLKKETREFFPRFLAMAVIAKNPTKYGFPGLQEMRPEEKHELVPVEGSHALETLARSISEPLSRVQALNPALLRGITPSDGSPYSIRVPVGKKEVLVKRLEHLPEEPPKIHVTHVVNKGDNVSRILKRYQINKVQLAELNPDVNLNRKLRHGSRLVVPVHKAKDQRSLKPKRLSRAQQMGGDG
jgi:membrane-bound lytic murein transglycosylase D